MNLLLPEHRKRLLHNGRFSAIRRAQGQFEIDFMPVVKLFVPWGGGTSYVSLIQTILTSRSAFAIRASALPNSEASSY